MDLDQDGCVDSMEDDDDDNDGVTDAEDQCRFTPQGMEVDSEGCSGVQLDDDGDGVHNLNDLCPSTPAGEIVSSTGCTVEIKEETKSNSEEDEESFSLITILFIVAGILVAVAAYVTFKPQPPLPPKPVPKVGEEATSTVNDGRGQGDGGTASADIGDTGLDIDASKPEVVTDEV